jgi:hypothetical protein
LWTVAQYCVVTRLLVVRLLHEQQTARGAHPAYCLMGTLRVKRPEREADNSNPVPGLRMSVAGLLFHIRFHGADSENFTFSDVQFVGAMHQRASCSGILGGVT